MIATFTLGLLIGLTFAAVCFICWRGERHIVKELRAHLAGEEDRNTDSFRAGMRMGHTAAQIDNLVFFPEPDTTTSDVSIDHFFPGTTPDDFPRPMGVTPLPTNGNSAA